MFGRACRRVIAQLTKEVSEKYNTPLRTIGALGFSGMMHGYMAFDKSGKSTRPVSDLANHDHGAGSGRSSPIFSNSLFPIAGALPTSTKRS